MASSGPKASLLKAVLVRNRAISLVFLIILVVLAWAWLFGGAGTGMSPSASLWPQPAHQDMMSGMTMKPIVASWSIERFNMTLAMWWIMMMAMMLPSAAPTVLLFARSAAHGNPDERRLPTDAFMVGYLIAWGLFSLGATIAQWQFDRLNLLGPMQMTLTNRWLTAAVLLLAGMYQLTPQKDACLRQCRHPAQFLSRHYRPGWTGALRMGVLHGSYCVGCCWLLMALLFVGGVMNLAWIAFLTVLVALEKLLPKGRLVATTSGLVLIVAGGATLLG